MELLVEKEEVWAASLEDKPGALAAVLQGLAAAGADLDFIIVRRAPEKPGTGVIFVTPIRGDREIRAATTLGFSATSTLHSVRVEGQNEPGVASKIAQKVADAGINMRGFSAAALGTRFVAHVGLDSAEDANRVVEVLSQGI
ncbi:MAG: ACT domain-containing protein [Thermoleophilia bacterium]|nr:ACT domain-containing protein [Thermoleophilia bacterium]